MDTNSSDLSTTNKILDFIKSRKVVVVIAALFGFAMLLGTFSVGVAVGYRKAKFSYAWGENYHRNFAGPKDGFMGEFNQELNGGDFIGGHGTFGQIIDIAGSELVVRGKDNMEKIIVINENTDIRRFKNAIQMKDLTIDESIVVIGEPNDRGQTVAKFIRIMPASPTGRPLPASPGLQRGEPSPRLPRR